jgi:hypothetical protein
LHIDIKNVAKQLDPGSISKVVCTQEYGPGISTLYTYVIAISGSDNSDEVVARLKTLGFDVVPIESIPSDVSMYTSHRRLRAEVRTYPGSLKQVRLGGEECKIPSAGITDIQLSGLDDPPSGE